MKLKLRRFSFNFLGFLNMQNESKIEIIITPRQKDLGGFNVRRLLPYALHRMVGPFIFFDHMGPAVFKPTEGIDVRPHPHMNLATVTYLFEGIIHHRDSIGSDQMIEPGAINWMTAGRGIVHSERTPEPQHTTGSKVNGIQLWVALPEKDEESEPSFSHHPSETLPEFKINNIQFKLLLGTAFGEKSPVPIHSDFFYAEARFPKSEIFNFISENKETAVYVAEGRVLVDGKEVEQYSMVVAKSGEDLDIVALEDSRLMLLGGKPIGTRYIDWNFVSSSKERLTEAKAEWASGPRADSARFKPIHEDDKEFIPYK